MSLFASPRFIANEFGPMFKLMDDYASHVARRGGSDLTSSVTNSFRSFTPKFDVKETKDQYVLEGELPGIEQKDVSIEFTDGQTLAIKGRTESYREEGTRPAGLIEGDSEAAAADADSNSSYHKPSVQDEDAPAETQVATTEASSAPAKKPNGPRYWVSERAVGEFSRSFSFPNRVDQENVKASLKNGILSIVVPKAAPPTSKRIAIE